MKLFRTLYPRKLTFKTCAWILCLILAMWCLPLSRDGQVIKRNGQNCLVTVASPSGGGDANATWTEVDKTRDLIGCPVHWPDFVQYGRPNSPGEGGLPYKFGQHDLSKEEWKRKEADFKNHYFDEWVSRKIAVHRSLPDVRSKKCLEQTYSDLPAASIVINFYNEEWSTLLRTLHSILDRTPAHLLKEIILIDDFSTLDYLQLPLEVYVQPMENVRLIRTSKRLGLIEARNLGSRLATGEILIFLDSHIECFHGWIEPLLQPIKDNEKAVTFPLIPSIDKHNFGILVTNAVLLGSLSMNTLQFTWMTENDRPVNGRDLYVESPTMPGGLYAISKSWFTRLGSYDPQLVGWGGENIEISLKIWMCGGSISTSICSRVAHVFRDMSPQPWPNQTEVTKLNSYRVAEVWLDSYKHYFYERNAYNMGDIGDVTERRELKMSLQCLSFDWYLNNVLPEVKKEVMDAGDFIGHIKNKATRMCLQFSFVRTQLQVEPCDMGITPQVWRFENSGKVWCMDSLLGYKINSVGSKHVYAVEVFSTRYSGKLPAISWRYKTSLHLQNNETNMCLDVDIPSRKVFLAHCSDSGSQKWEWQTREEFRAIHKKRKLHIEWD